MSNSMRNAGLLVVVACAGLAAAPSMALAGGVQEVGLGFTANTAIPGSPTLSVTWSTDPGALFTITPAGTNTWIVSLTGSGHVVNGGGFFAVEAGQTMSWADPINAGMYSNLTYIDHITWQLQILSPTAANTYNAGFGVFNNGVSIFAGTQTGSDIFAAVSVVPTPGAAGALGMGGLVALRRRRR